MKVLLACGGTGGHIIPALAVADALRESGEAEVEFVGVGKEIEKKLIESKSYKLHVLPFVPVSGGGIGGILRFLIALPLGLFRGFRLLRSSRPDVVVGFGGYPSFIPVICAKLNSVRSVLHEQNIQVGLSNKLQSLFVDKIFAVKGASGFWGSKPVQHIGMPVRKEFLSVPDWKAPENPPAMNVLILGGSQGAVSLNTSILSCVNLFKAHGFSIVHQSGAHDFERVRDEYRAAGFEDVEVVAFIDDIVSAYSQAHLVISRAGAMTVAEITAAQRPAIFVPLPIAGGHQAKNAAALVDIGAAYTVEQNQNTGDELQGLITLLICTPGNLSKMAEQFRVLTGDGEASATDKLIEGLKA